MTDYNIKQVIVWRNDLKVRKGKMAAQVAHASMWFLRNVEFFGVNVGQSDWLKGNMAKIVVQVNSEEELLEIAQKAIDAGLETHVVTDLGLTEFGGVPTNTCCAIGPDLVERINPITGHLKLM